jgi:hypothetical protein
MSTEITIPDSDLETEELLLPSQGIGHGIKKILVRPMTMREEKMLTNKTIAKTGKVHERIMKECIVSGEGVDGTIISKSDIDLNELYVEDEYALFVFLRMISYGTDYTSEITCPTCSTKQAIQIDLEKDLDVKYANEKQAADIVVKLPKSGRTVIMGLPQKKHAEGIENPLDIIPKLLKDVEGVDKILWNDWLDRLIAMDSAALRNALSEDRFGMQKRIPFVCRNPACAKEGDVQNVEFPITPEFFRIQSR